MKKITKLILTVTVCMLTLSLFCSISAFALTDGDWEFQLLDNEVTITKYIGSDSEVIIPESIYGAPVTCVERNAIDAGLATKIVFPATLKEINRVIDSSEYNEFDVLKEVYIPEGVEVINRNAFSACTGLTKVHLPSTIKKIDYEAFYKCYNLSEINLPEGLTSIAAEAFSNDALVNVEIPSTVTDLGGGLFGNNQKLESVKIKAPVKELFSGFYNGFFANCISLTDVEFPETLEKISNDTFVNCSSLKNIILPVSLKSIGGNAFGNCDGLTEVTIPYGVKEVSGAFGGCDNLKSLYIPDTVTNLSGSVINGSNNCIVYCSADSKAASVCKSEKISYLTDNSVNSGITILYNGTRISFHSYGQNPELLESRTLVPLRSIFEAMGADVEWEAETSTAVAKRDGVEIRIQIGASEMYKNGKAIPVDVSAQLLNSRTMVPVRVIAEAFGADVQWNSSGKTVVINE